MNCNLPLLETSTSPTRVRLATRDFRLASDSTRDDSRVIASLLASHYHRVRVISDTPSIPGQWHGDSQLGMRMGGGDGEGWWWWCGGAWWWKMMEECWWWSWSLMYPSESSASSSHRVLLLCLHTASRPPPQRGVALFLLIAVIVIALYAAHLLGLTRPRLYGDDLKSLSIYMDADLESSAGAVVADLASSSRPGTDPDHKSTPHRLPDNRQSSGSDNRHSLGGGGGRGGGLEERDSTRSDADASLRDSARIAGLGRITLVLETLRTSLYDDSRPTDRYSDPRSDSCHGDEFRILLDLKMAQQLFSDIGYFPVLEVDREGGVTDVVEDSSAKLAFNTVLGRGQEFDSPLLRFTLGALEFSAAIFLDESRSLAMDASLRLCLVEIWIVIYGFVLQFQGRYPGVRVIWNLMGNLLPPPLQNITKMGLGLKVFQGILRAHMLFKTAEVLMPVRRLKCRFTGDLCLRLPQDISKES
ncbi:hypothetical protein BDZ89DRAFT_1044801 [Hymenopellis radicata]|nr:hypothetical protein BDZ89DRAFT_1044801 [Hymenopellis radicata]